jgi:hypothetical protein
MMNSIYLVVCADDRQDSRDRSSSHAFKHQLTAFLRLLHGPFVAPQCIINHTDGHVHALESKQAHV